jgi:hypothetical protein
MKSTLINRNIFLSLLFILPVVFTRLYCQGIIVNEFSNGNSGSKEYMEFLVVGTPCTAVDLRGWIFDDNNGPDDGICDGFSIEDCNAGIAGGHVRFANIARWSSVPVGSLILIYNSSDKNTSITLVDDPSDSNNDLVYVLPITDSGLEATTNIPSPPIDCNKASYEPGNCSYSPVSYTSSTTWSPISLNNSQDACQTRRPDGSYFHGFSYGTSNMTGGPDALNFNTTGTGKVFYLNCGHHSFITDYSYNDVSGFETPGLPNNSLNQELVDYYRGIGGCGIKPPCVVLLSSRNLILKGKYKSGNNELTWYSNKTDISIYTIQRSSDNQNFETIGSIKSLNINNYKFIDYKRNNVDYYRILSDKYISNIIVLNSINTSEFTISNIYPNPVNNKLSFNVILNNNSCVINLILHDMLGRVVIESILNESGDIQIDMTDINTGLYYLSLYSDKLEKHHKIVVQH